MTTTQVMETSEKICSKSSLQGPQGGADTSIQDVPLKNINDSRVKAYPELDHYPTAEENDIWLPFVQGIDPDADEDIPNNIEVISDDGFRHKHIRVKGMPTEALAAMNELDNKLYVNNDSMLPILSSRNCKDLRVVLEQLEPPDRKTDNIKELYKP